MLDVLWEQGGKVDSKLPAWLEYQQRILAGTLQKMSRKKKLLCAIYATSQQRLSQGLWTANISSKLSVNDLLAKDSSLEDGRNVSEQQTNVRLSQSVHTKTKTKQKSVK